jgi:hypothetical protein
MTGCLVLAMILRTRLKITRIKGRKTMKRYWISWEQLSEDYRPLTDPPMPESIKAWWCSGHSQDAAMICAIVDALSEADAWEAPDGKEVGTLRFCEEKTLDWLPNDRFPITKDWQRERLGITDILSSEIID